MREFNYSYKDHGADLLDHQYIRAPAVLQMYSTCQNYLSRSLMRLARPWARVITQEVPGGHESVSYSGSFRPVQR